MGNGPVWLVRSPAPPLRPFVDAYAGYRQVDLPPGLHRGLPSRHLTCIVSIGDAVDVVAQTDPRQAPDRYRFVLSGLQTNPALIRRGGTEEGIAIELTPLGARSLLGMPARELWDTTVEAAEVMGASADELWERLQACTDWDSRFSACDEVLIGLLREPVVRSELVGAWGLLVGSGGAANVADIARQVGWSRQHLRSRFTHEFGLSPKLAARVIRFERARRMVQSGTTIASVAATCGYYDQAHLNLDFAAFAGCSPARWRREELPSFQDKAGPEQRHSAA